MDLHSAAKRYEEHRRFWAREIALTLTHGSFRNQRAILQALAVHGQPMQAKHVNAALLSSSTNTHSRETLLANVIKRLREAGLVTRSKRKERIYSYTLTELGHLVLLYLPVTADMEPKNTAAVIENMEPKNTAAMHQEVGERKKRGRPRKTLVATQSV